MILDLCVQMDREIFYRKKCVNDPRIYHLPCGRYFLWLELTILKKFIIESEATDIQIASLITGIYEGQRVKKNQQQQQQYGL